MKVVFLASSASDVRWFVQCYRLVFPAGSPRARVWLERSRRVLADNPRAGRSLDEAAREYSVPKTPFSLIYRLAEHQIEIMRLKHKRAGNGDNTPADEGMESA